MTNDYFLILQCFFFFFYFILLLRLINTKIYPSSNNLWKLSVSIGKTKQCSFLRWAQHLLWFGQHLCAHCDVCLLHVGCHGTQIPPLHLVEEVPHQLPDDPVCSDLQSCIPGDYFLWFVNFCRLLHYANHGKCKRKTVTQWITKLVLKGLNVNLFFQIFHIK